MNGAVMPTPTGGRADCLPLLPFQERWEYLKRTEGLTQTQLAIRLGWWALNYDTGRPKGDSQRVARALGLNCHGSKRRRTIVYRDQLQTSVTYATAVRLCRALDMDPFEAGI